MITGIVLTLLLGVYLIAGLIRTIKEYHRAKSKSRFLTGRRVKLTLWVLFILLLPALLRLAPIQLSLELNEWPWIFGFAFSFAISAVWVVYIRKLDIYEPEPWWAIVITFLLSCITIWAVFPLTNLIHSFGFFMNSKPVNDFLYSFIGIGMVEEAVKILPVLFILWKTDVIDEPFDYLLYASVSALGFAFIENISYINESELYSLVARLLMSSVAHMTFSSTVMYGLLLARKRIIRRPQVLVFLTFYLLASLSHGFYDFWILNDWASQFRGITMIFFLITVHIWFTMLNNALNISNFYDRSVHLKIDELKTYLILALLSIFGLALVVVKSVHGEVEADQFFYHNIISFGYFMVYIIYSHNRFKIIRGYMAPIEAASRILIPPLRKST